MPAPVRGRTRSGGTPPVTDKPIVWQHDATFVLAATGSAVGLGNIWRFPYVLAEHGGGAFLLLYLLMVAVMCVPLMLAEAAVGRAGRGSPMASIKAVAERAGTFPHWRWVGALGILTGFVILGFYSVVGGWSMAYSWYALTGAAQQTDVAAAQQQFASLTGGSLLAEGAWLLAFVAACGLIIGAGIVKGIERSIKVMMPALFVLLLFLVVNSLVVGDAAAASAYLFSFDFSKLGWDAVLAAMGQAFFSLSLGMGALMMYGAYMPETLSLRRAVLLVATLDTSVAVLSGLAIFPIVFAMGMDPGSGGPSLVFVTMTLVFGKLPLGWLVAVAFFFLLLLAAVSSAISLMEPVVAFITESTRLRQLRESAQGLRREGTLAVSLSVAVVALFCAHYGGFFDLLDQLSANYMLPTGGLLVAVFVGFYATKPVEESIPSLPEGAWRTAWLLLLRYLVPLGILAIFLGGLLG